MTKWMLFPIAERLENELQDEPKRKREERQGDQAFPGPVQHLCLHGIDRDHEVIGESRVAEELAFFGIPPTQAAKQGERAQAERLLQDGLRGNPAQSTLGLVLARLQVDRGAQAEALQTLEAGLPHARHSVEYLTTTAAVMARAGRHGEAAALYEDALRIGPGNAVWYMGLGLALRADGRPRDALAAFQRARDMRALNPELQAFVERSVRELQ